jgi:hypothetical protein
MNLNRYTYFLKLDVSLLLDVLNQIHLVPVIYSYALAGPTSSGRPPRPMYVRVEILGRGNLYYQIYLWQIKSPRSHIGGNETPHLVIAQTLEDNLPLSLGDISVQHGCFKLDSGVDLDPVRFLFRVAEDNAL